MCCINFFHLLPFIGEYGSVCNCSAKFGNPTEVIWLEPWYMTFDRIQDGGLADVCTLCVTFLVTSTKGGDVFTSVC